MNSIQNQPVRLCPYCFTPLQINGACPKCGMAPSAQHHPNALPTGAVLCNRYVVGMVLGKGGFGITYLCYDQHDECVVAVKEYCPDGYVYRTEANTAFSLNDIDTEEDFVNGAKKFFDEAKTVSRFNGNPNIIGVRQFFYENNTVYFVMEYLEGCDMKDYVKLRGGTITEPEAAFVLGKICEALIIVHSTGIFHRDISPDNIYLCNDGNIKLIDFGAARQVFGRQTQSLSVIFKKGFAPFEQRQTHGNQGAWTDIYALGATVYYLITGKVPPDAIDRTSDPELDMTGISEPFAAVIKRMMEMNIADRYQDVLSLMNDVRSLPQQAPAAIPVPVTPLDQTGDMTSGQNFSQKLENTFHTANTGQGASIAQVNRVVNTNAVVNGQGGRPVNTVSDGRPKKPFNKKILWIVIAAVLVVAMVPAGIGMAKLVKKWAAPQEYIANGVIYTKDKDHYTVTGYKKEGIESKIEILSANAKMPVTGIEANAFKGCKTVSSITVPEGVETIGKSAFAECTALTSVKLPQTVTSLEKELFFGCSSLASVEIQNGVESIGESAFADCTSLTSVKIPDSVTTVGPSAFRACTALASVTVEDGVAQIDDEAFVDCSALTAVKIPGSVKKIGNRAFKGCTALASAELSKGVKELGANLFEGCTALVFATVPGSVENIGECAFDGCNCIVYAEGTDRAGWAMDWDKDFTGYVKWSADLGRILPEEDAPAEHTVNGVKYKKSGKTYEASGHTGDMPSRVEFLSFCCGLPVTRISANAFEECKTLNEVIMPDSITDIGAEAFYCCNAIATVQFSKNLKSIGEDAFFSCNAITSIDIPAGLDRMDSGAFFGCDKLASVNIQPGATCIGDMAFGLCPELVLVTIPDSVTYVGYYAFSSDKCVLYIEAASKPSGWASNWDAEFAGTKKWGADMDDIPSLEEALKDASNSSGDSGTTGLKNTSSWKVTEAYCNTSEGDKTTINHSVSLHCSYFHWGVLLEGGMPDEEITLSYEILWPDGETSSGEWEEVPDGCTCGIVWEDGIYERCNGQAGAVLLAVYNEATEDFFGIFTLNVTD